MKVIANAILCLLLLNYILNAKKRFNFLQYFFFKHSFIVHNLHKTHIKYKCIYRDIKDTNLIIYHSYLFICSDPFNKTLLGS